MSFDNNPHNFTFGGFGLNGEMLGWSGAQPRRGVVHQYPKRAGARVEDMESGPRTMDVRLTFITDEAFSASQSYKMFIDRVRLDPFGLLVHPVVGQWNAFCHGPNEEVNFNTSINEIKIRVTFTESNLEVFSQNNDSSNDAATAAQRNTTLLAQMEELVGSFMAIIADAAVLPPASAEKIRQAESLLSTSTTPVNDMRVAISTTAGVSASVIQTINGIADKSNLLSQNVTSFIDAATSTDTFDGAGTASAISDKIGALLGVVLATSDDLEALLIAGSPTPAGAAEVVGSKDEAVGASFALSEAIAAERPPLINFTVPKLTDVISIAVDRYPGDDAFSRASEILGLNRIPFPGAIPAGTILRIYAK